MKICTAVKPGFLIEQIRPAQAFWRAFLFFTLCVLGSSTQVFAQTFVSLKPNITQNLMALGAAENIVGVTKFCERPNASAVVVADYQTINVEAVFRLQPDFIVLSRENTQQKQFEQLENIFKKSKTKIVVLSFNTLDEFYESYVTLASLLDKPDELWHRDQAQHQVTHWKSDLGYIRSEKPELEGKTFAVIVERQPLVAAGGKTFISTLLREIGMKNVFEKNEIAYPNLTPDAFALTPMDFVFDMSHQATSQNKFLGKTITPLKIEDFLASPRSLDALIHWTGVAVP